MSMSIEVNGVTHDVPSKFEVCSDCRGHGTHLMPSIRYHAYTEEEFRDFSDEEREAYFTRGGMYDVTCETCKGLRVMSVPDKGAANKTQRALIEEWVDEQYKTRMELEHEQRIRRAECGEF